MSYIQIEIGGKLRGLKFNQMAAVIIGQKVDIDNYQATAGYAMIWVGLKANCYVKGEEADFTFEQVCDWVDEVPQEVLLKVITAFQETQLYKNAVDKGSIDPEPATKKKSRKTELKT